MDSIRRRSEARWAILTSTEGSGRDGQSSLRLKDLAGYYGETAFTGLSTSLEADYGSGKGFTVQPSSITVDLIETGLPIENISASYTLYPNEMAFDMADLRMEAFGGVIRADPFSFRTASKSAAPSARSCQ